MIQTENLSGYRLGHVVAVTLSQVGCCHMEEKAHTIFTYLELIYNDGSRIYIYEDPDGCQTFEKSFLKNRFNRFHDFFTTEELAIEDRGFAKLKYYVRRKEESYLMMPIADALAELEKVADLPKLADRITRIDHFDTQVDYHMDSEDRLELMRY